MFLVIFSSYSCSQIEIHKIEDDYTCERIFEALIEGNNTETKTILSGEYSDSLRKILWRSRDSILVINKDNGKTAKFVNMLEQDEAIAHFKGEISASSSLYYAFYPYRSNIKYTSNKISFELPKKQHYNNAAFSSDEFPMLGVSDTLGKYSRLKFKNICGVLVVNLKGKEKVKSIIFRGVDSSGVVAKLSGPATILTNTVNDPVVSMSETANNEILLDCGDGVQLDEVSPTAFYVVVPPGKYSSFSVIITSSDGKTMFKRTTNPLTIERSKVTKASALVYEESKIFNLSEEGTANSYIVTVPGLYKFDASVIGNGVKGMVNPSGFHTSNTRISPFTADLIWQDLSLPVSNISYDSSTREISFIYTGQEGNALIAARNELGTIIWSWHIWCTDEPKAHQYANNAGVMMDRNLGAISSESGSSESLGLFYQWGRKDPFVGSVSLESADRKLTTISWPSAVSSTESDISYFIKNPTLFVRANSYNGDWLYSGNSISDDTRWGEEKTIYDPCPYGWRVPKGWEGGVWDMSGFRTLSYSSKDKGLVVPFYLSGQPTWYPAQGYIGYDNGNAISYVGTVGYYWSTLDVPTSYTNWILSFGSNMLTEKKDIRKATGLPVRCQKDEVISPEFPISITIDSLLYVTSDSAFVKVGVSEFSGLISKGVVWSTSPNPTLENNNGFLVNNDSTNVFISKIALEAGKIYYLKGFAKTEDDIIIYSDEISFITSDHNNPIDLSINGTANCYMVHRPGTYKFRCDVKGNNEHSDISDISGVTVIWETVNTLEGVSSSTIIKNVRLNDNYIEFDTPQSLKPGNVLLGVRNSLGVIMWSWHIWVTEYNPDVYYNKYLCGAILMDRNLGALDNINGSVKQRGLLYQWGRKDPFTGAGDIDNKSLAMTSPETAIVEVTSTSLTGSLDYIESNPSHVLTNGVENDWLYSFRSDTLWHTNKSQFDPCPPGWRVPDAIGTWDGFGGGIDNTQYYIFYQPSSDPFTVYPMVPYLLNSRVLNSSNMGRLWSCTTGGQFAKYFNVVKHNASDSCGRETQMSVRCAKDQSFRIVNIEVDSIKNTSATLKFKIVSNSRADLQITEVGALVSDSKMKCDRISAHIHRVDVRSNGEYNIPLTELLPNKLYYFIVYAQDVTGAKYSNIIQFKTALKGENEGLGNEKYVW